MMAKVVHFIKSLSSNGRAAATYCRRHRLRRLFSTAPTKSSNLLNTGLREHLKYLTEQYNSLQDKLNALPGDAGVRESGQTKQKHFQELASLKPLVKLSEELKKKEQEMLELELVANSGGDRELQELAVEELASYQQDLLEIQRTILHALIPADNANSNNVILEVRAGVGGKEASLFTAEIFLMYERWSQLRRWKFEVLECNAAPGVPGYKHASASVSGQGVYGVMKFERGVHRVQRVPVTDSSGRVHTSTSSVAILAQPTDVDVTLAPKEVKVEVMRSSGPGGQHVNTTDSSVRLTHLPTGLVVRVQSDRSQHKNRTKAYQLLRAKLYEKKQAEVVQAQQKVRQEQHGSGERHERIRTYNFPQDRVTDHRASLHFSGVEMFMQGEVDLTELWQRLETLEEGTRIAALLEKHSH